MTASAPDLSDACVMAFDADGKVKRARKTPGDFEYMERIDGHDIPVRIITSFRLPRAHPGSPGCNASGGDNLG